MDTRTQSMAGDDKATATSWDGLRRVPDKMPGIALLILVVEVSPALFGRKPEEAASTRYADTYSWANGLHTLASVVPFRTTSSMAMHPPPPNHPGCTELSGQ